MHGLNYCISTVYPDSARLGERRESGARVYSLLYLRLFMGFRILPKAGSQLGCR
jgi:hypothetical protein